MKPLKVDFANQTIIVTQAFAERAGNVFSADYNLLVSVMKNFPTYALRIIYMPTNTAASSNCLSYNQMEEMIMKCPDEDERAALLRDFYEIRNAGQYALTKKWFLGTNLIERFSSYEAA